MNEGRSPISIHLEHFHSELGECPGHFMDLLTGQYRNTVGLYWVKYLVGRLLHLCWIGYLIGPFVNDGN